MRNETPPSRSLAKAILELLERSQPPLSVAEQCRRYRQRRKLPDWAWAIVVGLIVSAGVVVAILLGQNQ